MNDKTIEIFHNQTLDREVETAIRASNELAAMWSNNRKKEHDALYKILAQIYSVANKIAEKTDEAKAKRKLLQEYLEENGIGTNARSSLYAKVTKVVFHEALSKEFEGNQDSLDEISYFDNQKLSTYARVMKLALKENIKSADFYAWLTNSGGISAVLNSGKRGDQVKENAMKKYADEAIAYLLAADAQASAHFEGFQIDENELGLAIVRGNGDKTEIVDTVKDTDTEYLMNLVLGFYGKFLATKAKEQQMLLEKAAKEEAELNAMAGMN